MNPNKSAFHTLPRHNRDTRIRKREVRKKIEPNRRKNFHFIEYFTKEMSEYTQQQTEKQQNYIQVSQSCLISE